MSDLKRYRIDSMNMLFVGIITVVLCFPLFLLLYRYMPSLVLPFGEEGFRIDHILLFLMLFFLLFFIIKRFQIFFIAFSIIALISVTILNFAGVYTLENLYNDYNKILYNLGDDSLEKHFFIKNEKFTKEEQLRSAIDYNNPIVVQFARNIATTNFQEYKGLIRDTRVIQYFSIFKEIKARWVYVYDPKGEDYYSKASENINSLTHNNRFKGDCDDYSILVAACIRAIGGEVRLIRTRITQPNGTSIGHMYPEVKIGDKKELDNIAHLIKTVLFPNEVGDNPIRYYQDSKGYVWLNFDYNDDFPGGRYQSDERVSEMEI
ncbi:MAG: transglutaminase domain-containing protein [Brumimicrobium sp.]